LRRTLELAMKDDCASVAEADALREFREDAADRRLVTGAKHHAKLIGLPDEDAAGHRSPFDRGAEGHRAVAIDGWRTERSEAATRGRRVALGDDLAQPAARRDQHRLQRLATAPQPGQEDDVAACVDR